MYKPHFLQSQEWANARQIQGWKSIDLQHGQHLLLKRLPLGKYFGYMPQVDLALIDWEELQQVALSNQVINVQLDPHNLATEFELPIQVRHKYHLKQTDAIYYRHTTVLDLSKSLDDLMSAMKPKTRYNIKLGRKNEVKIELRDDQEGFEIFLNLFFETVRRQSYFGRSAEYYRQIWDQLQPSGKAKVALASYHGEPVIAWMLFLDQKVIYYPYGGSSDKHRNLMANYALVAEIVEWGKSAGYHYFDLWGTLGESAAENDPEYGFHRFKIGFGGEQVTYAPAYDMVISYHWYWIFKTANSIRWLGLRLKRLIVR